MRKAHTFFPEALTMKEAESKSVSNKSYELTPKLDKMMFVC